MNTVEKELTQEQIEALTLEQRYEELTKELGRAMDRFLKGTEIHNAEVILKLPKLKDGKPIQDDREGKVPSSVKRSLDRLVDSLDKETAEQTLDMLENIATKHPALDKDPKTAAQVKRMFEIRRELNALERQGEKLMEELAAL